MQLSCGTAIVSKKITCGHLIDNGIKTTGVCSIQKRINVFHVFFSHGQVGKLPVPGRPTILITVGQGPIALAVGAGRGGSDIFTLIYPFSSFALFLGDGSI